MGRITVLLGLGAGIKPSSSEFPAGGGFSRTLYPQPAAAAPCGPAPQEQYPAKSPPPGRPWAFLLCLWRAQPLQKEAPLRMHLRLGCAQTVL